MSRNAGFRLVLFAVLLALPLSLLTACGSQSTPEKTIRNLVAAYNKLDMDGVLDCIEPAQADAIRSLVNIAASLAGGISGQDLFERHAPVQRTEHL